MSGAQVLVLMASLSTTVVADSAGETPDAAHRTNGENYKDRLLAVCISRAYEKSPAAAKDASVTASAMNEWSYFDIELAGSAPDALIDKFLRRDYHNPLEGYANARFDLLKCIDLFHSRELEQQVNQFVPHPNWVGRTPSKRQKGK